MWKGRPVRGSSLLSAARIGIPPPRVPSLKSLRFLCRHRVRLQERRTRAFPPLLDFSLSYTILTITLRHTFVNINGNLFLSLYIPPSLSHTLSLTLTVSLPIYSAHKISLSSTRDLSLLRTCPSLSLSLSFSLDQDEEDCIFRKSPAS